MAKKHSKGTTETRKIVKAVVLGPMLTVIGGMLAYLICWLLSEAFMRIHSFVAESVIPWLAESWWIIIGIWLGIAVATTFYYVLFYSKNQQSEKKENVNVDKSKVADFNDEVQMFHK